MEKEKVLLCGIGKLENNYIREWVEHHRALGFDNIVLYDNNDVDGERFEEVISDYIESGYVILKDWRGRKLAQIPSYNSCYDEYNSQYDWIGFWDIDEFIELEKAATIQEFLSQDIFADAKCIRVGWKQYTDSGLLTVENGNYSVKRFTEVYDKTFCKMSRMPVMDYFTANTQAKSIIRSGIKGFHITSPHCFLDVTTVNAIGKPAKKAINLGPTPIWQGAWLNHYRFKTIEEYVTKKMVRLWPTKYLNGGKDGLNLPFFFRFNKKTPEKEALAEKLLGRRGPVRIVSWTELKRTGQPKDRNWGDDINFLFLKHLFNKEIVPNGKSLETNYSFIGSILCPPFITPSTIVWGSGIQVKRNILAARPKMVCAVRGPLTREYLLKNGMECPEIYGDPSLLIPYYYYPKVNVKYEIGFIPHHSSLNAVAVAEFCKDSRVHLIKTKGYGNWKFFIDEILSCKYIVSESLHGIIMAEAYGIPNLWVDLKLDHTYDLKFHDFFLSLGQDRENSVKITTDTSVDDILKRLEEYKPGTLPDLKLLASACPIEIDKTILERINSGTYVKEESESAKVEKTVPPAKNAQRPSPPRTLKEKIFVKRQTTMNSRAWKTFKG